MSPYKETVCKMEAKAPTPIPTTIMEERFLNVVEEYRRKMRKNEATDADLVRGVLAVAQTTPGLLIPRKHNWYDFMERLIPYRDLFMLLGGALIIRGAWMMYPPAAFVICGALAIKCALMMARP